MDNDNDNTTDCNDTDCANDTACSHLELTCDDGIDNDGDGDTDCDDNDCDNDNNCLNTGTEVDCSDGLDNDNDGLADCSDSDCASDSACSGSETLCDDGVDNDSDGLTDCSDADCGNLPVCANTQPEDCVNGADDDGDGDIDCDDSDCANDPVCSGQGFYDLYIYPALQSYNCTGCHPNQFADYATLMTVQAGDYSSQNSGANMPWITAGDSSQSYLFHKVSGSHLSVNGGGSQMPMGGTVSSTDLLLLEDWINAGAPE